MTDWTPESLYDYFDQFASVAETRAGDLRSLESPEQVRILHEVRSTWAQRLRELDDGAFISLLVTLVEDLYFLGVECDELSRELLGYVVAVWGTGLHVAEERGYRVRYLIDNHWRDPGRAQAVFSLLAPAAEMTFVLVLDDEGPVVLKSVSGHAVYLDPRGVEGCLDAPLTLGREPGDVVIERHAAPTPGSPAHAWVTPLR